MAGTPRKWRVVSGSEIIRAAADSCAASLGVLYQSAEVKGTLTGEWLALAGGAGYILVRHHGVDLLKSVTGGSDTSSTSRTTSSNKSLGRIGLDKPWTAPQLQQPFESSRTAPNLGSSLSGSGSEGQISTASEQQHGGGQQKKVRSFGSDAHKNGTCKPCVFAPNCIRGDDCRFCHEELHEDRVAKVRPCKGKREQYKYHLRKQFEAIRQNPKNFDFDNVQMPDSIRKNEEVKNKFLARLRERLRSTNEEQESATFGSHDPGESSSHRSRNIVSL